MKSDRAFDVDDEQLDRLVDGELSADEYADLLARLEEHPDGWRRCAQAFLEAQAWERDFAVIRREADASRPAIAEKEKKQKKSSPRKSSAPAGGWLPLAVAMAASFLIAFGVDLAWRSWRQSGAPTTADPVDLADTPRLPTQQLPAPEPQTAPESVDAPITPVGTGKLVFDQGHGQPVELSDVTLHEWDTVDRRKLEKLLKASGPQDERVHQYLRGLGHHVAQDRRWLRVPMSDGRVVLVPVDRLRAMPDGFRIE